MTIERTSRLKPALIGLVLVAAGVGGVVVWRGQHPPQQAEADKGRGDKRPVPVVTALVARRDVPILLDGLGTIQAYQMVTVHTRIDGELTAVAFKEGQDVHAGDLLARLDPRTYQAQLEQAEATREKDVAQLDEAKRDLERYVSLGNRVTGQSVDTQRATVKQLEASVKIDQAAIDSARTMLSYTNISSPIEGRTGLRLVDKGNIVHAGDATGLVVVTQLQPISVIFTLPQQSLRGINDELKTQGKLAVTAYDSDSKFPLDQGEVTLVDNQIDQTTGTIRLKATLPNAQRKLWPGGFVNVRLLLRTVHDGLVVPAPSVQRGPQGSYVYVVKPDQTVEMRAVKVATIESDQALLDSGVETGETVVVDGMAKLQAGSKIMVSNPEAALDQRPGDQKQPGDDKPHKRKRASGE